jgi:hypothetical protein
VIYLDFEALPTQTSFNKQNKTIKTHLQKPCSFGLTVICPDEHKHYFPPITYLGEDCVEVLIKTLKEIETKIFTI